MAEGADSWEDAGVGRGAARSWRLALGALLAPRWDDAPGGQQLISGFSGTVLFVTPATYSAGHLVQRDGDDIFVLLCNTTDKTTVARRDRQRV